MDIEQLQAATVASAARLDQAIAAAFPAVSRRAAKRLLDEGRVLVNGHTVGSASRNIAAGSRIELVTQDLVIPILARGNGWIAVDKPAGLATQMHRERQYPSVLELLHIQLRREGVKLPLFLVHRLDTPTSGVLVLATSQASAATLSRAFSDAAVRKFYVARVEGEIADEVTVSKPIADSRGIERDARSTFRPLRPLGTDTLVEVEIFTGRTHQIRIHAQSLGHPVVGDPRYGGRRAPRLMLHASRLVSDLTGTLEAPVPDELAAG